MEPQSLAESLPQMNQETALAQAPLRDGHPQGVQDPASDHRHEVNDANVNAIALIGAGMALLGILLLALIWLLLNHYRWSPAAPETVISPLALTPPTPPAPRIEEGTEANNERFVRYEESVLYGSGTVPAEADNGNRESATAPGSHGKRADSMQSKGTALHHPGPGVPGAEGVEAPPGKTHVSIEQAKATMLQRGFPTRPQTGSPLFPQNAPAGGRNAPESLPIGMQPTGTYRADVGPTGKNP